MTNNKVNIVNPIIIIKENNKRINKKYKLNYQLLKMLNLESKISIQKIKLIKS